MGGIAYADRKGFIPVIDMKNYPNGYLYDDEVGKINSWEYFLEQPGGISLEDALASRKYIINNTSHEFPAQKKEFFLNKDGVLDYWRGICRKYIRFKPHVLESLAKLMHKAEGRKVLGVLVRGTDFVARRPKNHPIPPTAEQAIAKVREVLDTEEFDTVYLATEDKNILAKFQAAFGDKLMLPECEYVDYDYSKQSWLTDCSTHRNNDKYLRGFEYLVSMLFLSRCKGFVASMTSGSVGVMCLSEGFDYLYVFDLGFYQ
ncbi:MAG: O-fucosyltransferase family protein [Synergistaceae bacterium]|nr:O-fucosyltransferase family protein [Synergistaceae bacterium]